MRLFFYIALILSFSSCRMAKRPVTDQSDIASDSLNYDLDGVPDFVDEITDTDGDGINDSEDKCPEIRGTIDNEGCPIISLEVSESITYHSLPDHFIKSLSEIEDKELRNYFIESGFSVRDVNVEILNSMRNRGLVSEKQYSEYRKQIQLGKVPSISNNSTWIPDVENMDIIDKTKRDTSSSKGTIAYSVPSNMIVGKQYPIKVRITKEKGKEINKTLVLGDREIPISDVTLDSKITIENIRVERTMTAQLLSEDGAFKISKMNTDSQVIEDAGYTEWSWIVVPINSGDNYLKMIIKIKVVSGKEIYYKDIVVFEKNIKVKTNVSLGVKSWISQYWQWLMTTIIIPLVIFFYKKRKNKEE